MGWCSCYWTASSNQTSTLDCFASWLYPLQTSSTLQLLQLSTCTPHVHGTLHQAILTTNECPQCSLSCCNKSQQDRAQPCSESSCAYTSLQRMPCTADEKCCSSLRLQMPPAVIAMQQCTVYLNVHLSVTQLAATGPIPLSKSFWSFWKSLCQSLRVPSSQAIPEYPYMCHGLVPAEKPAGF